jgi:Zn-dependent M28 family amino/carboxypeptidase
VRRRRGKVRLVLWTLAVLIVVLAAAALWTTQPVFFVGAATPAGPAPDRARLERRLRRLVEEFHPRDGGHPENMARAAAFIGEELRRTGAAVSRQLFETAGARYENVVAAFGPDTPDVVVVGAHYDVAGEMPGADDNASGVAGLLELADLLSGSPLARRVELVAYANEEAPFFGTSGMGSEVHARSLESAGRGVRAMICLEMIGCFTDASDSQQLPFAVLKLVYPTRGNFIAVVGSAGGAGIVRSVKRSMMEASDLPVRSINAPRFVHGVDLSDHSTFWKRHLPAVMISDTAFYRNPRYHTEHDTPDTLDYSRMAKVVAGVCRAVIDLAR